jgi:large subunit ribosomal protein L25
VLNAVRHELELICDAAEIPDEVEISLAGLDIGDSLHISAVTLPKGTESAITDRDFTIATIVPRPASRWTEDAAAEAAEPAPETGEVPTGRRGAGGEAEAE